MAAWMNAAGLVLNLAGVFLLFRYGMPYRVSQLNEGSTFADPPTARDIALNAKHKRLGGIGLVLIVSGTAFQLVATAASSN
jgi:hypothetical protein